MAVVLVFPSVAKAVRVAGERRDDPSDLACLVALEKELLAVPKDQDS